MGDRTARNRAEQHPRKLEIAGELCLTGKLRRAVDSLDGLAHDSGRGLRPWRCRCASAQPDAHAEAPFLDSLKIVVMASRMDR